MDRVFIFSGTTEGRELSEILCGRGIENVVFVATDYGAVVMDENSHCEIRKGRLGKAEIEKAIEEEKPSFVVDATHPYAIEVSKNIKAACEDLAVADKYIRISRELPLTETLLREDFPDIEVVLSTEEAIDYLKKTSGNILLTTGVKTISQYTAQRELKDRIVARILPSKESLDLAYEAGLSPHQIIAMEGPFVASMNEATMEQYNIKTLVTKNSGIKGGFIEKLEACQKRGAKAVVIDINKTAEGISLEEAKRIIAGARKPVKIKKNKKKQISIVGIGAGNETTMTVGAKNAIKEATLIIGAKRMLEIGSAINSKAKTVCEYRADEVLEICDECEDTKIAYLVSGDTGFFSGATQVKDVLKTRDYIVKVFPGISSIAYFASLIGLSYSEAAIISAHGRECDLRKAFEGHKKIFAIVSGFEDVNTISEEVKSTGRTARIYVGYNLGLDDEEIVDFMNNEKVLFNKKGLYVVGVVFHE